jgi:hypothetical protein
MLGSDKDPSILYSAKGTSQINLIPFLGYENLLQAQEKHLFENGSGV